ncbi:MAG TPA: serine/threonine-protein kinase [Polyangiaceae bacterium]
MIATTREGTRVLRRAYRQLFELGRGGMARVHLAESLASGIRKLVVLKVLNPEFCGDPELRAAFRREAELSAQLNHPNVVQVLEVADYDDAPAMVMEYLDGVSLSRLLKEAGAELALPLRAYVLSQVLAGLHHFHELQDLDGAALYAVHRDVSPQNVMVLHDGVVKVVDFGIAKVAAPSDEVTRAGVVKGKIHYMPPEQLLAEPDIDRRADLFAVGVMLWEAIALKRMWRGMSETEVFRSLASGAIPRLEGFEGKVPSALLDIVARATAAERSDRFATAQEMQAALDAALAKQGWLAQPRDLAAFMAAHFGDERRAQELRVKDALRATPVVPPGAEEPARTSTGPVTRSDSVVSGVVRTKARFRGWGVAALCCALAGTALFLTRRPAPVAPVAAAAPERTVALEIEALPRGAAIYLDGRSVGTDRAVVRRSPSSGKVLLEVRAEGFVTQRKELALVNDLAMQLVLQPEAKAPSEASAAPVPIASASPNGEQPRAARQRNVASSAPRAASKKKSKNCNPPYTFSADGIKTYKAECY